MAKVKVTSAFSVDGKVARPGDVVELPSTDAYAMVHRGKAVMIDADYDDEDDQKSDAKKPAVKAKNAPPVG